MPNDGGPLTVEAAAAALVEEPRQDQPEQAEHGTPPAESASAESADPTAPADEGVPEEPLSEPGAPPPADLSGDDLARFQALPPATQAWLVQREAARAQAVQQQSQAAQQMAAQHQQAVQQYAQMIGQASALVQHQMMGEFTGIDWNKLAQDSPHDYIVMAHRYNERQAQLQALQGEQQRVNQQQQAEAHHRAQQYIAGEMNKLQAAEPLFADPAKARAEADRIRAYLGEKGFGAPEISGLTDHRHLLLVRKAMQFDAAEKIAATKLDRPVPNVLPPGVARGAGAAKAAQQQDAMRRLEKTGSLDDAVALVKLG